MTSHPEPVDAKAAVERLRDLARHRQVLGVDTCWEAPVETFAEWQAADLIDRLQADNERMVEERDIWRTACNQISNRMIRPHSRAEIMDIVRSAEDRQRLQCSGGGDPT